MHAPTADDLPRLGRFAVVRRLGAGGMAEVFLARARGAEGIDKYLVVKRIHPAFAQNSHFRAMFVEEARVALRLNHPNVVQVYGFESDGPTLLLTMEHVDGPDLGQLAAILARTGERLPPPLAAWVVREVARGLHYAHERRDEHGLPLEIVHRDVSPSNVLLSYDGAVKLGDFGIARARSASDTDRGTIKGKVGYMAPEQARGDPLDRRADVWSLGVTLAELLAGRGLYHGVAAGPELLAVVRRGALPALDGLLADAPDPLAAVVRRALRPARDERFATARELGLALGQYLHHLAEPADAVAWETYLARVLPLRRTTRPAPFIADPVAAAGEDPAATVLRAAPAATVAELRPEAAPLRERVHVAVVVGRVVAPSAGAHTVDTGALFALLESLAFKAGATLDHTRDGFTLVVGAVRPQVDDALRAARLALDILDAARSLGLDAPVATPDVALGLARGVAGCARDADGTLLSCEVVDDAAALAAALATAARAGEALVAAGLHRLVRRAFLLREHPTRGGGHAWLLDRVKTRAERDREIDARARGLTGREGALQKLREALARAGDGAGRAVVVNGELGSGKSAVLAAFAAATARGDGAAVPGRVIRTDAAFGAGAVPWAALGQAVRQLVTVADGGDFESALAAAVERSTPSPVGRLVALRALRVGAGLQVDEPGAESATAREIVLALRRLLTAAAADRPVALLVDALEFADRPSRAALAELARHPPAGAVLVVLALRDDDPLTRELRALPAVVLGPLDADARRRLVAHALGADDAADDLVREVSAVAGGNPMMILEVVEALEERERVRLRTGEDSRSVAELAAPRDDGFAAPVTLEDVLGARLEALAPEGRRCLRWCALVWGEAGAALDPELIDQLMGEEGPRARARLVADGILVPVDGAHSEDDPGDDRGDDRGDDPGRDPGGTSLVFAHGAMAAAARASIDPTAVPAMHARVAECLEGRPAARGVGAAVLARHREAAGAERPAARAWLTAAAALRGQRREDEARGAYARVLALCAGAVDGEGAVLRFAAHLGREDVARIQGRGRARRSELQALRRVAAATRDPRLVAPALARQARYRLEAGRGDGIERDVAAAVRAARRAGEARTEAEARRVLAVHLGQRGRYPEALAAADAALAALGERAALLAPPGGSDDDGVRAARALRVEVLLARGQLLRQAGDVAAALGVLAEAYGLAARHGPRRLLAQACAELGRACYAQGDYADALAMALASLGIDREAGHREGLGAALCQAGEAYAALGQEARAVAFLRRAVAVNEAVGGARGAAPEAHVALAELLAAAGDAEGAAAAMARARAGAAASRQVLVRVCLGDAAVHLARRQYRLARVAAEGAERVAREAGAAVYALHGRAYAAAAAAAMGDRAAARRYVEAALGDPLMAAPADLERGDRVLAACERALRALGEVARADALAARAARLAARAGQHSGAAEVG